MSLVKAWKTKAKELRYLLRGAYKRSAQWESVAKEHKNAKMARDLEAAKMDAFAGWVSARLLQRGLEQALERGVFAHEDRIELERTVRQVHFAKPEDYEC